MGYTPRNVWADLKSSEAIDRAVRRSQMSQRRIADEVTAELRRIADRERRHKRDPNLVPRTCSHALIGQLCRGTATTVHELRAIAIERTLSVGEGDLFTPRVVHGAPTKATA